MDRLSLTIETLAHNNLCDGTGDLRLFRDSPAQLLEVPKSKHTTG